jgi:Asp-tRNA(Asn)/Glu-tRNA(Gln) amidotransferase C subunit
MTLEEKIAKVEVINKTILELKQMSKTQINKTRIQKLQQEIDKIIESMDL